MGRLAKLLDRGGFSDIHQGDVIPVDPEESQKYWEEKIKKESGPVKTKLDLSLFEAFGADKQSRQGSHKAMWAKVDKRGNIIFTDAFSRKFSDGAKVMIYLNSKGNIMVIREEEGGMPLRYLYSERARNRQKSQAKRCGAARIARALTARGVNLPARFMIEGWDDDLQAWVGRRENG